MINSKLLIELRNLTRRLAILDIYLSIGLACKWGQLKIFWSFSTTNGPTNQYNGYLDRLRDAKEKLSNNMGFMTRHIELWELNKIITNYLDFVS